MTTLKTTAGTAEPIITTTTPSTTTPSTAAAVDPAALITEQQVLFASAAALAPASAPAKHHHVAHDLAVAVRAMFARHERTDMQKHHPQRYLFLEHSAMSREMYRL